MPTSAGRRRVLLLVPPLLAAAALAALLLRGGAGAAERERTERGIRLRCDGVDDRPALLDDVARYLRRYGTPDDAAPGWFAVEAYACARDVAGAVEAVRSQPALRGAPGAARRLARLLVDALSVMPGRPDAKSGLAGRLLLARLDADEPAANREWEELVPRLGPADLMTLYVPARRASTRSAALVADGFSRSTSKDLQEAGAILRAGPERREDVPRLVEIFRSSTRDERRPMWRNTIRALGATGDPRAVSVLREERARLASAGDARATDAIDLGLALADDAEARERILASDVPPELEWRVEQLVVGLGTRLAQGDDSVLPRVVEVWERVPRFLVRLQLGQTILLADPAPKDHPVWARWADELAASREPLARVVGHAWRFRARVDEPFGALADDLVAAARSVDLLSPPSQDDPDASVAVEVLRAWLRWGR